MDDISKQQSLNHNLLVDGAQMVSRRQPQLLRNSVEYALRQYFEQLGDNQPASLYELVMAEVEVPLLQVVLQKTKGNQTKAAKLLGLSRGTLRKKLKQYDLEDYE